MLKIEIGYEGRASACRLEVIYDPGGKLPLNTAIGASMLVQSALSLWMKKENCILSARYRQAAQKELLRTALRPAPRRRSEPPEEGAATRNPEGNRHWTAKKIKANRQFLPDPRLIPHRTVARFLATGTELTNPLEPDADEYLSD